MTDLDFVDRSAIAGRGLEQLTETRYWFDDREIPRAFGQALGSQAGDLLSVAIALYASDRIVRRAARAGGVRDLAVRMEVQRQTDWVSIGPELQGCLRDLTGDRWTLEFQAGRPPRISESQLHLFGEDCGPRDSVALFSGGLDSLAGAAIWLDQHRDGRLFLIGARSSSVIGRDQRRLFALLREWVGDRVHYLGVPIQLRNWREGESTQRVRSLLFIALAVATAVTGGIGNVLVFENGYGAVNPRLAENQVGHHLNRGTHPRLVARLEQILRALGFGVSLELPHLNETKAELLACLPRPVVAGIRFTASCDSYPLRTSRGSHCGVCGSCILRRQSLLVSGLSRHDRRDYIVDWRQPEAQVPLARLMSRQAWQFRQLARAEHWETIRRLWPEIGETGADPDSLDGRLQLDLFRRYGVEWDLAARSHSYVRRLGEPPRSFEEAA